MTEWWIQSKINFVSNHPLQASKSCTSRSIAFHSLFHYPVLGTWLPNTPLTVLRAAPQLTEHLELAMGGQHVLHAQSNWLQSNFYHLHSLSLFVADHYFLRGEGVGQFLKQESCTAKIGKKNVQDFLLPLFSFLTLKNYWASKRPPKTNRAQLKGVILLLQAQNNCPGPLPPLVKKIMVIPRAVIKFLVPCSICLHTRNKFVTL